MRCVSALPTCFHEVAVSGILAVAEDFVPDGVELSEIPEYERVTGTCCTVVTQVSELDASINEEAQSVR